MAGALHQPIQHTGSGPVKLRAAKSHLSHPGYELLALMYSAKSEEWGENSFALLSPLQ